jgi:hypothetical protein
MIGIASEKSKMEKPSPQNESDGMKKSKLIIQGVAMLIVATFAASTITSLFAQSLPCAGTAPSNACGGATGWFPWPVICSYYPPEIDACYTAQTTGIIQECVESTATSGSFGCTTAPDLKPCRYTEYFANCCGNAQHAPQPRVELVPYFMSDGTVCPY